MNNKLVTSAEYPRHGPCQKQVDPQFKHFSKDMDRFQALFKTVRTLSYALHFYSVRSVYQSFYSSQVMSRTKF